MDRKTKMRRSKSLRDKKQDKDTSKTNSPLKKSKTVYLSNTISRGDKKMVSKDTGAIAKKLGDEGRNSIETKSLQVNNYTGNNAPQKERENTIPRKESIEKKRANEAERLDKKKKTAEKDSSEKQETKEVSKAVKADAVIKDNSQLSEQENKIKKTNTKEEQAPIEKQAPANRQVGDEESSNKETSVKKEKQQQNTAQKKEKEARSALWKSMKGDTPVRVIPKKLNKLVEKLGIELDKELSSRIAKGDTEISAEEMGDIMDKIREKDPALADKLTKGAVNVLTKGSRVKLDDPNLTFLIDEEVHQLTEEDKDASEEDLQKRRKRIEDIGVTAEDVLRMLTKTTFKSNKSDNSSEEQEDKQNDNSIEVKDNEKHS